MSLSTQSKKYIISIFDRKPELKREIDNFINPLKVFSRGINIPVNRGRSMENINSLNNNQLDNIPPITFT